MQGALWVYESLLAPGLKRGRSELAKFPALEKALTQFDQTVTPPQGVSSLLQKIDLALASASFPEHGCILLGNDIHPHSAVPNIIRVRVMVDSAALCIAELYLSAVIPSIYKKMT